MRRFIPLSAFLLLLCLTLAACDWANPTAETPAQTKPQAPLSLTFTAQEHPELDFSAAADGLPKIRDFCFTPQGHVLLLQLSDCVTEYDPSGRLLGIYSYPFAEQGWTACRLACGNQDRFYLLDGHNNAVLSARRNRLEQAAFLDDTMDAGAFTRFACDAQGRLVISTVDLEGDFLSYTCTLDVTGEHAVAGPRQPGLWLDQGITFQPQLLGDEPSAAAAPAVRLQLYQDGQPQRTLVLSCDADDGTSIAGLSLWQAAGDTCLGHLFTLRPAPGQASGEQVNEYLLRLDLAAGTVELADPPAAQATDIRYWNGQGYYLYRQEDAIVIRPLSGDDLSWQTTADFSVQEETPA